ncbi:hypothetical protein INT46_011768 [Mucor plumbeus]|uniref:F-box domain-containing protein n=1 Tax=Mucor plumbeus TaxID=97098 RepID=A0A8H7UU55_9FUNG|nr:hypothetical protein INT46_011768 [Mucor plumbeus]
MAPWNAIPTEVLKRILQCIDSIQQLGECRLVHTSWDYPAESAMFSKNIDIKNDNMLYKFCRHLRRKPGRGKLITHLNMDSVCSRTFLEELLRICFTPNMEALMGDVLSEEDVGYKLISEIVLNSTEDFNKLRYVSNNRFATESYLEMLSLFKESLERMDLQFTDSMLGEEDCSYLAAKFASELSEFKSLNRLDLQMYYNYSLKDMEKILDNCPYLEYLRASIGSIQCNSIEECFGSNKIKKFESLKILVLYIDPGESPILLEYCLTKYPNIEKIIYHSPDGPPDFADEMGDFPIELEMLKSVPYYEMEFTLHEDDDVGVIRETMQTEYNNVVIDILDRQFMG